MAYQFLCPYCFAEIHDDEVMFRSAKVNDEPVEEKKVVIVDNAQELTDTALPEDMPVAEEEEVQLLSYLRAHILKLMRNRTPVTPEDLYPNYGHDDCDDYDGDVYDDWTDFTHQFSDGALKTRLRELHDDPDAFSEAFGAATGGAPKPVDGEDPFFYPRDDEEYVRFWKKFTLKDADFDSGEFYNKDKGELAPWKRPILDPKNPQHQPYLQAQEGGGYLIFDANGMAAQIQLREDLGGQICSVRVCPHCHNPLPENYGKLDVKFLTLIGITASGKTVYLSRLFENMPNYMAKVGLATEESESVEQFLKENPVRFGEFLPVSTSIKLHQPLFFDLGQKNEGKKIKMRTLVIYDVSGECFEDPREAAEYLTLAPFIQHSDGIMLLVDPSQIRYFAESGAVGKVRYRPSTALRRIRNLLTRGDTESQCETPVAVCISKMDQLTDRPQPSADRSSPDYQSTGLYPGELSKLLTAPIEGIRDPGSGKYASVFNTQAYQPVLDALYPYFQTHDATLTLDIDVFYANYSYFTFTALGGDVKEEPVVNKDTDEPVLNPDGTPKMGKKPEGPVASYRIEEPLLWLFTYFGYIDESDPIRYPWDDPPPPPPQYDSPNPDDNILCPDCGKPGTFILPYEKRDDWHGLFGWLLELFRIRRVGRFYSYYNRKCGYCGRKFWDEKTQRMEDEATSGAFDP